MANGNGGDDYDFTDWTKTDCTAALNQVAQIAEAAYDPMSSREDLAQALSDILDALGDGDDDDTADDGDDDGDAPPDSCGRNRSRRRRHIYTAHGPRLWGSERDSVRHPGFIGFP